MRPRSPGPGVAASGARGFTMIEVMMALTVLMLGMLGIVSLQKAAVTGNQDAHQSTVANNIGRSWVQRLQRDAARWTSPSPTNPVTDIGNTAWLASAGGSTAPWFVPPVSGLEPGASAAADFNGAPVPVTSTTATYCTHLRLRYIYPNELIRAEVRVFWARRTLGSPADVPWIASGICSQTTGLEAMGGDELNFSWVYTVAAIPRTKLR